MSPVAPKMEKQQAPGAFDDIPIAQRGTKNRDVIAPVTVIIAGYRFVAVQSPMKSGD
jgi:hypothetical protein